MSDNLLDTGNLHHACDLRHACILLEHFDAKKLLHDYKIARKHAKFHKNPFKPKSNFAMNKRTKKTEWANLTLIGEKTTEAGGRAVSVNPDDYIEFPILQKCKYFKEILDSLQCPKRKVRLAKLEPGAFIKPHKDVRYGWAAEEIVQNLHPEKYPPKVYGNEWDSTNKRPTSLRLHIPIITNKRVDFRVNKNRIIMNPGELWYLDLSDEHSVKNGGKTSRTHMIIDVFTNDWLINYLARKKDPVIFTEK